MTPGEKAVATVDRSPFIPDTVYVSSDTTGWLVPLHRADDPDRWDTLIHSDEPVVTATAYDPRLPEHLRDPATGRGVMATSSSSAPPIMARMLDALALAPGMRVLEIGTGTGYNAALLTHLTGPGTVTTVELDPELATHARAALDTTGYQVSVITGDGAAGHPSGAPYDRVVATAAVHTVPYPWVNQARPGGLIVAPWAPTFHPDGPLVVLTVGEGGTAQGRCVGPAHFMPLHSQRVDPGEVNLLYEKWDSEGVPDCTRFGVTITPAGQRVWLDTPDNHIAQVEG